MKKILVILGVLVAVVVVAAVLLLTNLGAVIRAAVESYGSDATGAEVTLAHAEVSLTDGRGTLRDLKVGNPDGFTTPHAFALGEISLEVDPATATSDVVVIRRIAIGAPQVTYELDSKLRSNLAVIQDNVEAYAKGDGGSGGGGGKRGRGGKSGSGGGAKPDGGATEPKSETRFVVDEFTVADGSISVAVPSGAPAGAKPAKADMPSIRIRDLGRDRGGLTKDELAAEIVRALTKSALAGAARGELERAAKGLLDSALDKAKEALDGIFGGKKK